MKQGRLGYNSSNDRYGLLASDLWIDTGFHCGEGLEVLVDDKWVRTRMEMNPAREWYLVGTPYCVMPGDTVELTVELIHPIAIEQGTKFSIREGGRTVGSGNISEIIE